MQMGAVLMFGVFVTLGTWGYLEAFASSDSVKSAAHSLVLPVTWADSQRGNPDGRWETRVILGGVNPGFEAPAVKAASASIEAAVMTLPAVDVNSHPAVPLPARRTATLIAAATKPASEIAVPLPERSPGMMRIISAQMLPVRRPDELTPVALRVAQAAEAAKRRRAKGADARGFDVSTAVPMPAVSPAVVNRADAVDIAVNIPAAPRRRPDFGQRWALGGLR